MVSETLTVGLQQYRIGLKVRALRKGKKLGLVQLSEHTGLSPGMLSKLERGQLFPTLPTLMRIALVFGVGLEHFFTESQQRPTLAVIRREDRLRLPDRKFNRGIGMFASLHFDPAGAPLTTAEWERRRHEWLPAPSDREYLLSIMAAPVYEPGKFANYIAPPIRGINRQPINFEYVRTET